MINERLKQFAEQSGFRLIDIHYAFNYNAENEFLEYAKLVAQDCISQIALIGISNYENDDVMWAVGKSIENIKERYGVK